MKEWVLGAVSILTETAYAVVYKLRMQKDIADMALDTADEDEDWISQDYNPFNKNADSSLTHDEVLQMHAKAESVVSDWLRRFGRGWWDTTTGLFTYSIPGKERLAGVVRLLKSLELYLWAVLRPHDRSIDAAIHVAQINGYDKEGNALVSGGYLRGLYYGTHIVPGAIIESVVICNWLRTEQAIRVREIRFVYLDRGVDATTDLRQRLKSLSPNRQVIRDGWCNIGPTKGSLYDLDDRRGMPSNYPFGEFNYDASGDRIAAFTVWPPYDRTDRMTYRLCRTEEDFARVTRILEKCEDIGKPEPGYDPLAA